MTRPAGKQLRDELKKLRNRHRTLMKEYTEAKAQTKSFARRRFLSPGEQLEHRTLQRLKLYKKDALAILERRLAAVETQLGTEPPLKEDVA
jgi:hypothetical protein